MNSIDDEDFDTFDRASYLKEKEENYEERIATMLLRRFDLNHKMQDLRKQCEERTGDDRLSLTWFYENYPTFPVLLAARRLAGIHQLSVDELFRCFTKTKIFRSYLEWFEEQEPGFSGCVGVAFNWPGLGTMVMHDYASSNILESEDALFVRMLSNGRVCTLERWRSFIKKMSSIWTPL